MIGKWSLKDLFVSIPNNFYIKIEHLSEPSIFQFIIDQCDTKVAQRCAIRN